MRRGLSPPLLMMLLCACAFDPNANPLVDIEPVCDAASQDDRYFGAAFPRANQSARELLEGAYSRLSDYSEPSLACGTDPDEVYRLTIAGEWPNVPLIIRAQRSGEVASVRALFPRHDPGARKLVAGRVERPLSTTQWASLVALAAAVDVESARALIIGDDRHSNRRLLIEFRRDGMYGLVERPARRGGGPLDAMTEWLIALAGIEYPWF